MNQCPGCARGLPIRMDAIHYEGAYPFMACTADRSPKREDTTVFNEDSLWREITGKWGAFGAHAEVYSMLLRERDKLKSTLTERDALLLKAADKLADMNDSHGTSIAAEIRAELEGKS